MVLACALTCSNTGNAFALEFTSGETETVQEIQSAVPEGMIFYDGPAAVPDQALFSDAEFPVEDQTDPQPAVLYSDTVREDFGFGDVVIFGQDTDAVQEPAAESFQAAVGEGDSLFFPAEEEAVSETDLLTASVGAVPTDATVYVNASDWKQVAGGYMLSRSAADKAFAQAVGEAPVSEQEIPDTEVIDIIPFGGDTPEAPGADELFLNEADLISSAETVPAEESAVLPQEVPVETVLPEIQPEILPQEIQPEIAPQETAPEIISQDDLFASADGNSEALPVVEEPMPEMQDKGFSGDIFADDVLLAAAEAPDPAAAVGALPEESLFSAVEAPYVPEIPAEETQYVPEVTAEEALYVPEVPAQDVLYVPEAAAEEALYAPEAAPEEALYVPEVPAEEPLYVPEAPAEEILPAADVLPGEIITSAEEIIFADEASAEGVNTQEEAAAEPVVIVEEQPAVQPDEIPAEEIVLFDDASEKPAETAQETEEISDPLPELAEMPDLTAAVGDIPDEYYTLDDGILKVVTTRADGSVHTGTYIFSPEGLMVTGEVTYGGRGYYFRGQSEAKLDAGSSGAKTPWNSTYGQPVTSTWRWVKSNSTFKYYDAAGKYCSISAMTKSQQDKGTFNGYFYIAGDYYALSDSGKPRTGTLNLKHSNGNTYTYYFNPAVDADGLFGKMFFGWLKDTTSSGERWRYFSPKTATIGQMYVHGTILTKLNTASTQYLLNKNGYLVKSACAKASNGKYYHTDKYGRPIRNKILTWKNRKYYYGSTGARVTWKNMWHKVPGDNNRYYYFGSIAGMIVKKTGWQRVYSDANKTKFVGWFYFYSNGRHKQSVWMSNKTKYILASGKLASGFTTIGGKRYFFKISKESYRNGSLVKGQVFKRGSDYYYAASNGVLKQKGWVKYDGFWYYINNYKAVKNKAATHNGVKGYIDDHGRFLRAGWNIIDDAKNKVEYIGNNGLIKGRSAVIDGYRYYFDDRGYRINDVTDKVSGGYYLECDRVNGVITVYSNANRTIPVKSIRVSVGAAGTETPLGSFTLTPYARWVELMGPSWGQYGTHVYEGIFIHSIPMNSPGHHGVPKADYARLGNPASHGCIRMCVADAKWVYENCGGATIRVFDGTYNSHESFKGPLGRRALVPMYGDYDPTDPEV